MGQFVAVGNPALREPSLAFFPLAGGGTAVLLSLLALLCSSLLLHDWTQNGAPVFFGYFEVHVATSVLAAELFARGA
jgi:hypothetical protein